MVFILFHIFINIVIAEVIVDTEYEHLVGGFHGLLK
jgi:hypothetical protein